MRTIILFLAIASFGVSQTPSFNPAAPIAAAGQSITITSNTNVTWSLAGAGTISNQTANSVTYTAPSSVIPQSQMLGCPVQPNDSIFNTRIDALPVNPNSATWLAHMSTLAINILPSWGITYADASTPMTTIKPYYGDGAGYPSYSWPNPGRGPALKREGGNYVGVTGYGDQADHHVLTVRKNDCTFYELYDDRLNGETFLCADGTTPGCNTNSTDVPYGWAPGLNPYAMPLVSTDAAGLPLAPLSFHLDEVKAGAIKHAIRYTASAGYINGVTWPAVTANASAPQSPPYGARFRLKTAANGGPNLNTVCTSNSTLNQDCVTLLTALQQYGMVLSDIGLNNQLESVSDLNADPLTRAAVKLINLSNIGSSNFEAVDESRLQPQTANGFQSTRSYEVDPANGFVTPSTYALITATPSTGSAVKIPVALQGTAIGLKSNVLTIQAGTWGGYQIQTWVNPSSFSQTVNWTKVSGVGTISSGGVYTPPADTTGGNTAVLKATALADSNAVSFVYVTVLQPGASPAGALRIDTGSTTGTTDGTGNFWSPDYGSEVGASNTVANDYPGWSAFNPEHQVYESCIYTYGPDIVYNLVVPNGNYKIRYMFGQPWNGASRPYGSLPVSFTTSPSFLEAQGIIEGHYFDWNYAANYQIATPVDAYIPARVTNNTLVIAERRVTPDSPITLASGLAPLYKGTVPYLTKSPYDSKSSLLNGLEIIPDSSTPHWTIDTQQAVSITPGQSIQLYVVDWYTGDSDVTSPSWTLLSKVQGATISSSGLLTLSSATGFSAQPIVIKASGSLHSATATIYTAGGNGFAFLPTRPSFHYYFKRTLTLAPATGSSLTNFPVVISVTDPTFASVINGGHIMNASGYDIVPTTDSTCASSNLSFDIDSYDGSAGTWVAHVKLPTVSSTAATTITLCYGNPAITTSMAAGQQVWDANYNGVYHFGALTKDATALGNDLTNFAVSTTQGLFGTGAAYNGGGGQYLAVSTATQPVSAGTLEMWLNNANGQNNTVNWGLYSDHETANLFQFGIWYYGSMYFGWENGSNDYRFSLPGSQITLLSGWNHLAYTWDATANSQVVYLNGAVAATRTTPFTPFAASQPLVLGADGANGYNGAYKGVLDEVRFSKIPRSASWIATEYANQNAPGTFVTMAAEQHN